MSGRCLRGVWGLSELLLILFGSYNVQVIDKHPIRLIYNSLFLLSQLPWLGQNAGVSVGCLEGVCEVSVRCLVVD